MTSKKVEADEDTAEAVEKVLGEPIATEFSDKAWKIRTNLITAAAIAVALTLADLHIAQGSTILGLQFLGLSDVVIRNGLVGLIAYLLIHFCWVSWDSFLEWRLRVTGTRRGFVTGMMWESEHTDIPKDPRQSTLYNWWKQAAPGIRNLSALAQQLEDTCKKWEADLQARFAGTGDWTNISNLMQLLVETRGHAEQIKRGTDAAAKALASPRIAVSLSRFDAWFQIFLRSQNLRWLLIDFVAPVGFSIWALYLLRGWS